MSGLNENHKRKILATVQHVDELLGQSSTLLVPESERVLPSPIGDLTRSQAQRVKSSIARIRAQIAHMLQRMQVEIPLPTARASWLLRTNLTMLDIVLQDIYPEKMLGCGELDPAQARKLARMLEEIRKLIADLLDFLNGI